MVLVDNSKEDDSHSSQKSPYEEPDLAPEGPSAAILTSIRSLTCKEGVFLFVVSFRRNLRRGPWGEKRFVSCHIGGTTTNATGGGR
jgi:hypothetical protein